MVKIRSLTQQDLSAADRIISVAFGTFLGVPEPEQFWADLAYARTRWPADPTAAFGAEWDGELVGSNFATRWGSVGFFGPLTVRPDLWDRKIAQRLMDPIIERFDSWGVTHAGCSRLLRVRSIWGCITSTASDLGFSPPSCRRRSGADTRQV